MATLQETVVVDQSNTILRTWADEIRGLGATFLRSPVNQSPHKEPGAFSTWIEAQGQWQASACPADRPEHLALKAWQGQKERLN